MNDPFNPIPIPENLNLTSETGKTPGEEPGTAHQEANSQTRRKARKKTTKRRPTNADMSEAEAKSKWQRIRGRLAARVAQIDKEKLKALLLVCGIAAGIVAAVIIAIKLVPLAAIILAALGLGAALRFWERLRYIPRPF